MTGSTNAQPFPIPTILPMGDSALLVRFGASLTDEGNRAAISLTRALDSDPLPGTIEIVPNLISVLLRYDPLTTSGDTLAGELRLRLFGLEDSAAIAKTWQIDAVFDGPDLGEVAQAVGLIEPQFIAAHNAALLRVLATGFAPGFVYCGLHDHNLVVPRRSQVRQSVPAGTILFAAGQTAITATEMPTGWHVIGRTGFANFDPASAPPTRLRAGDVVQFRIAR